jgi:uncharacterized membrane protein YdjX (TVP38/TMEM64 family)
MTTGNRKKLVALGLLALLVAAYFGFGLDHSLTLAGLKASRDHLAGLYAASPGPFLAGYFVLYVLVAAASQPGAPGGARAGAGRGGVWATVGPGATVLTLAGAALFGFWTTLVLVSFASTIGATAACALCRTLFRDVVRRRLGPHLAAIDAGMRREGAFYLFSLRLIPVFPFFVVNAAMGLTDLPLAMFAVVSQIGMLPATAVYINAGQELGRLDSLAGIISPGLLLAFALLGLLPLAARRAIALWRARKTAASRNASGGNA